MDPNIGKATGKERTVAPCKESPLLEEVNASLLAEVNTSAKHNLMSVGGCA
jgi:hypothetical protein